MRVISASRRTDIPAFYGDWLENRLAAGWCAVPNHISRKYYCVSLRPEDVLAFVFWTRNATPFLPSLRRLLDMGYRGYFQYTITPYGKPFELSGPSEAQALEGLAAVSDLLEPEFVQWRYDPIIISDVTPWYWHLAQFERLAEELMGRTTTCVISFAQLYAKNRSALDSLGCAYRYVPVAEGLRPKHGTVLPAAERRTLATELARIGARYGLRVAACCDSALVDESAGVFQSHCLDRDLIRRLRPEVAYSAARLREKPTRAGCGCFESVDIGAYDTCPFGCVYCYASKSQASAKANLARHNPRRPALFEFKGKPCPDEELL